MISFADVVHQSISFDPKKPSSALILKLIDTSWFQRLREIGQTANTRLLYMFSEHSRFGHCVGVAYLASILLEKLKSSHPTEVKEHELAVCAAALLHDIGHLAPGSHVAQQLWFPNELDSHEEISCKIILEDTEVNSVLKSLDPKLPEKVAKILKEDSQIPPWTWEIISGGAWNVDRGNWCAVDSVMAGVSYGKYNIPALIDSIVITKNEHLALKENRLDSMIHFIISRQAMYRQVYQHRVLLAADGLCKAIVSRASDLSDHITFADATMNNVLKAKNHKDLSLEDIFLMRESWFRYHLHHWSQSKDKTLADLSTRFINRKLFKTVRINTDDNIEDLTFQAKEELNNLRLDPKYYLQTVSTRDVHASDYKHSIRVLNNTGEVKELQDVEPLFKSIADTSKSKENQKTWLVMPEIAKVALGRKR